MNRHHSNFRLFKYSILVCFLLIICQLNAQTKSKLSDSVERILNQITYSNGEFDKNFKLTNIAIAISERINDTILRVNSYAKMGDVLWYKGIFGRAEDYYLKSLYLANEKRYPKEHAYALYSVGWIECVQKQRIERIGMLRKSYSIYKSINDTAGLLYTLNAISGIYGNIGEKKGKEFYLDSAIYYLKYAIKLTRYSKKYNVKLSHFHSNLAEHYFGKKDYKLAELYVDSSIASPKTSQDLNTFLFSRITKAKILAETNRVDQAISLLESILDEIYKHDESQKILEANRYLYLFYKKKGDYKQSLYYFEIYLKYQEKASEELLTSKLEEAEANDRLYKNEKRIASLVKQKELFKLKERQRTNIAIGGSFVLLLVLGFLILILRRNKKINILNQSISKQKELIEEKHLEIKDSINYAKRIQDAVLPSNLLLKEYLKNGFVLFNPKDIVSGDFYWMEKVGASIYFAAADCTGHGVPGAMVSVVCANALSKALLEEKHKDTGKLLDRTRELVIESFSGSDAEVKDGMDISLCRLDGLTLHWSGANNPLWIIRKDSTVVEEIKADKQPIGRSDKPTPFQTHSVQLAEGDSIYLFTDGYADQFGGEKGKKFMYKPLKDLLLKISKKQMDEQKEMLADQFMLWKGNLEQVDDVCVIGVKI